MAQDKTTNFEWLIPEEYDRDWYDEFVSLMNEIDAEVYTNTSQNIDVRTYGAVGNGATDDTAAIQAALNYVSSSGAKVYFPAGTYLINSDILPDSNTTIEGDQNGGTIIRINTGYNNVKAINISSKNNITIKNLTIDGNLQTGSQCIYAYKANNVIIENCIIKKHLSYGIQALGTVSNYTEKLKIKNCIFDASTITNTVQIVYLGPYVRYLDINNNEFKNVGDYSTCGIYVAGSPSNNEFLTIINNYFHDWAGSSNAPTGMQIRAYHVKVNANNFYNIAGPVGTCCVWFGNSCRDAIINNNIFYNIVQPLNMYHDTIGVVIDSNIVYGSTNSIGGFEVKASEVIISNNVVYDSGGVGINAVTYTSAASRAHDIVIANNIVNLSDEEGIAIAGILRCTVIGNQVFQSGQDGTYLNPYGIRLADQATHYCDYIWLHNNVSSDLGGGTQDYGLHVSVNSTHVQLLNNDFRNNNVGEISDNSYEGELAYKDIGVTVHTGDLIETDLKTYDLPAHSIGLDGGVKIMAAGLITGVNDTKTIRLKFGTQVLGTITQAAGDTDKWAFYTELFNYATNVQYYITRSYQAETLEQLVVSSFAGDTTSANTIKVTAQLGNTADGIQQHMFTVKKLQ